MHIVLFQFLPDIFLIVAIGYLIYAFRKNEYKKIAIGLFVFAIILKSIIFFDFTNSNKRVKEESQMSNQIFQSKMEKAKRIPEFNYTKDYKDVSNSISNEANEIHNSIKK